MKTSNRYIYKLKHRNIISIYDKEDLKKVKDFMVELIQDVRYMTLNKDVLIVTTNNNEVWQYQKEEWKKVYKSENIINGIVHNSKGKVFLITNKGVEVMETSKTYPKKDSLNTQVKIGSEIVAPSTYFVDQQDLLWLGFNYGEWGGDVIVFDTAKEEYLTLTMNEVNIELLPVVSFFEVKESVYFTSGLEHLINSGSIVQFYQFSAKEIIKIQSPSIFEESELDIDLLGAGTFSKEEEAIYVFAGRNILKGNVGDDLSDLANWEKVLNRPLGKKNKEVKQLIVLDNNRMIYQCVDKKVYSLIRGVIQRIM